LFACFRAIAGGRGAGQRFSRIRHRCRHSSSILVALPLMAFNNRWVQALGALFDKVRRSRPSAAAPAAAKA
jgi:hypothetical protein